jgi:hypothetical protein
MLDTLRALASRILNDEPGLTGSDVRRMAVLLEYLDARIADTGALPKVWAEAVAKAEDAGHTEAAIAGEVSVSPVSREPDHG